MGWAPAIKAWLTGRRNVPPPTPTADYYFLGAVGDLVAADGDDADAHRPIRRLGPHSWACEGERGRRAVVVRYVTAEELGVLERGRWNGIDYIVDDLLPAAAQSDELPDDYRQRLSMFAATLMPPLLAVGPAIIAPSPAILAAFPKLQGTRLDPCCLALTEGALPEPASWTGAGHFEVAFLGTRSHAGSLALIAGLAGRLEERLPSARLTLFFGRHLPAHIQARRNVANRPALGWKAYRSWQRTARFHVGLAPVQPTPFAMARSLTKVMDHAAVGAVGVYSARAPFVDAVTDGCDGVIVAADDPDDWADAIVRLAQDPDRAGRIARGGQTLATRFGDPARLRRFWIERLGLAGV